MATRLGLSGTPRRAPLWKNLGAPGGARPDKVFSRLGLGGTPGRKKTFTPKGSADPVTRPDKRYSSLGLSGTSARARKEFDPKPGAVGIVGRTTLTLTPQATVVYGRRYTQLTDLVLGIRPIGAVITVAHTSNRTGRTTLTLTPRSTTRYTRAGEHHSFQGNNTITFGTFGNIRIRRRRGMLGSSTLTLTPQATTKYTPAPVRHHHVAGFVRLRLTPHGTMARQQNGLAFSVSGSNRIAFAVNGRVQVTRQTTYTIHGRTTITLTPRGTVTKGTGPPVAYYIVGGTTLTLTPRGTIGYNVGHFEQHRIEGGVLLELTPRGRVTVRRAPSITGGIDLVRAGEKRFIRVGTRVR